jgi:ribosomal protein S18 acetylase RimI-like enzyme
MQLRPLRDGDLPRLVALHNGSAPPQRAWTLDEAARELRDLARGGGAQVVVACQGDEPVGFAGWVWLPSAPDEFYGAPVAAVSPAAAAALVVRLLDEARGCGAAWIRIGTTGAETAKRDALVDAGFTPALHFVYLRLDLAAAPHGDTAVALEPIALAALDHRRLAELNNLCFAGAANAPPLSAEMVAETWSAEIWSTATQVWADVTGRYVAFLLALPGGLVDSIGVHPRMQGRGLARALMSRAIEAGRREGLDALRSMVASNNHASLRLHASLGFVEELRRTIWQRTL